MIDPSLQKELLSEFDKLSTEAQRQVAEFARQLAAAQPRRRAPDVLLRFTGSIDTQDLRQMEEAIREGCEKVDANGW
jgi:hypothetical protein